MSGFFMFLASDDSSSIYTNNTYKDFCVEFDHEIVLEAECGFGFRQQWQFAVTEVTLDTIKTDEGLPESTVILCDLCKPSYIKGTQAQVLRTLSSAGELTGSLGLTHYIGVNKNTFNRVRISLLNRDLKPLLPANGWPETARLKCTLHFIRS